MSYQPAIRIVARNWFWLVFTGILVLLARLEKTRFADAVEAGFDWMVCLSYWDMETSLPLALMIILPVLWMARRKTGHSKLAAAETALIAEQASVSNRQTVAICAGLFALTLLSSYRIGSWLVPLNFQGTEDSVAFADLPPTYHDEFSYLLQAATFYRGHLSYPPAKIRPDLFHQFHVLNERRTVSRYFPLTGAWIAGTIAIGQPIHGHWFAGALATVFFYLSLLRVVSPRVALVSGILIAVSPGMAVFSNLLLAHHPTLLALSIFTWCFLRMDASRKLLWAFCAGFALTLAMLGRPMTAAGYAMPYGILLLLRMIKEPQFRRLAVGFVIPICLGFVVLGIQNHNATGNAFKSPYQSYTDSFTPRHKYGFNNAVDTAEPEGPPALKSYDNWATNLTAGKAAQNVWNRLKASSQWSLATIPVLFGVLMALPLLLTSNTNNSVKSVCYMRLIACSVLTLHLVHLPYWFDGIMHWHYVFETAPLLLAMTAVGLCSASSFLTERIGRIGSVWVAAVIICGLLPGWFQLPMFNDVSKVSAAISEQSFSRTRMEFFGRLIGNSNLVMPALVLVDEAGTDPQLSYIINPPDYESLALVCRLPASEAEIEELQQFYSDRTLYVFDPVAFRIRPWVAAE